jgi:YidC/Oxa1 family membrane protein insertase
LAYPEKELAKGEETTYRLAAFLGPKERDVLAHVGGGERDRLASSQLIDLGMFGAIGRFLVGYVIWLAGAVGSWGWAIALLTVTVKFAVFPLQLPSMRTSIEMRRVKPEVDAINARYGDDMVQKNLALQELYRREGIRPMVGCLPLMLQMPVWFSLYAALQSAVELYHNPFGPFIPDLSQSDPYHVIPIILGASSFLQQKLMPAQGMDPAQQKLMQYLMPGMFTAMMFFMPAGLGVYMITNTWLGILQQVGVERFVGSRIKQPANIEVREVSKGSEGDPPATGKGKVRARG